jgi:hypothetical protein
MTEFWKATDAFAYFGAVMTNPRSSWSARGPHGSIIAVSVRRKIVVIVLALLAGGAATAADAAGLPVPLTGAPLIYSAPTPAPVAPPINPGPAIVPPAGLSPLLTEPGPVFPTSRQSMPAYPSPQLPGPTGQQNMQSYRNSLFDQQWDRDATRLAPAVNVAAKSSSS